MMKDFRLINNNLIVHIMKLISCIHLKWSYDNSQIQEVIATSLFCRCQSLVNSNHLGQCPFSRLMDSRNCMPGRKKHAHRKTKVSNLSFSCGSWRGRVWNFLTVTISLDASGRQASIVSVVMEYERCTFYPSGSLPYGCCPWWILLVSSSLLGSSNLTWVLHPSS